MARDGRRDPRGSPRHLIGTSGANATASRWLLHGRLRGEPVRDRGRLAPVRRTELAKDVRDVDARRLDADDERLGDLAIGVAAGDEREDLRLARCEPEDLLEVLLSFVRRSRPAPRDRVARVGRVARALRPAASLRFESRRRTPPGAARLPPYGARRRTRAPPPGASGSTRRGADVRARPTPPPPPPTPRLSLAACARVLGLGQRQPAVGVRRDRRGLGGGACERCRSVRPHDRASCRRASLSRRARASAASSAWARNPCRAEPDAELGGLAGASPSPGRPDIAWSASVHRRSHSASSARTTS